MLALSGIIALVLATQPAAAIGTAVPLGTTASYSVLGGQTVTNTGPSVLNRDVGVSPGTAITGFPPGVALGATHPADAHALQAQSDLTIAYNNAAGQAPDASIAGDLGGQTLAPGVYNASSSIGLTGTVTLDGEGDPNAVFIFQVGSTLTTASASTVALLNDAQACNVFWQIGSSATLGTDTTFVGTIMALTSITANTGATVDGRALARNGAVTLDSNIFTSSACVTAPPTGTSTPTDNPTATPPGDDNGTPPGDDNGTPPGDDDGTPPNGDDDGTPPNGDDNGTPPNGDDDLPPGGSNGTPKTLAVTGPSANVPLLAAACAAILAGIGLIATSIRLPRTKP
ncbi:ice-binding family protein [Promicromonospora soli]|uniref:DUF3494 domain-containing protein n=1 Tax=Promicromonospora soli TaxID=2035533 RepID=A0A919FHL3_9MICO|nr:ice-binding family protein [Promicromonospora soli]GHH65822.1 hypothetical protein GCM10017772_04720 [Promicromonospora soli]